MQVLVCLAVFVHVCYVHKGTKKDRNTMNWDRKLTPSTDDVAASCSS